MLPGSFFDCVKAHPEKNGSNPDPKPVITTREKRVAEQFVKMADGFDVDASPEENTRKIRRFAQKASVTAVEQKDERHKVNALRRLWIALKDAVPEPGIRRKEIRVSEESYEEVEARFKDWVNQNKDKLREVRELTFCSKKTVLIDFPQTIFLLLPLLRKIDIQAKAAIVTGSIGRWENLEELRVNVTVLEGEVGAVANLTKLISLHIFCQSVLPEGLFDNLKSLKAISIRAEYCPELPDEMFGKEIDIDVFATKTGYCVLGNHVSHLKDGSD